MTDFIKHSIGTAPEAAKPLLETSLKNNGGIPGPHAVMADAPGLLATYNFAHQQFLATSLTDEEKTVVWQVASRTATTASPPTPASPR